LEPVLPFLVQFCGARCHPGSVSLLAPLLLVASAICVGAVLVPLLGVVVSAVRGRVRSRRARRRGLRTSANVEARTRALMSELCPHGWRAQITMLAESDEDRPQTSDGRRARVALDWIELQDESGRPAVTRRVWAQTIGEALDAMIADRRTDEALERIEQGAVADGALWPDL
jgi:hypothetical protein